MDNTNSTIPTEIKKILHVYVIHPRECGIREQLRASASFHADKAGTLALEYLTECNEERKISALRHQAIAASFEWEANNRVLSGKPTEVIDDKSVNAALDEIHDVLMQSITLSEGRLKEIIESDRAELYEPLELEYQPKTLDKLPTLALKILALDDYTAKLEAQVRTLETELQEASKSFEREIASLNERLDKALRVKA